MSGKIINQATLQAVMLDNTELPANHEFQDYKVNGASIKAMLDNAGYLKGAPSGVSVTDQNNSRVWQLDQKRTELTVVSGTPNTITPNAASSDKFIIQPGTEELQLQVPTNAPTVVQMGAVYAPFYFTVVARNSTLGTAGFVSFSSAWEALAGSQPYNNNAMNIIHCWYHPVQSYYRIETVDMGVLGQEIDFDVLVESAEILTSNTTPVVVIPAQGANKIAVITKLMIAFTYNGVPYATNVNGIIAYQSGDLITRNVLDLDFGATTYRNYGIGNDGGEVGYTVMSVDTPIRFSTLSGNPTAGDGTIRFFGTYQVITLD